MARTLHTPGESAAAESAEPTEQKPAAPLQRSKYLEMLSSEVDPTTLTRSVLCKDGWVAPLPKDKDGKPQTHLLRKPGEA